MIDLDALIPGSAFFRWREAINFPKWGIHAFPPPEIHKNIIWFAKNVADPVRNILGKPVNVHSWWRSPSYNDFVMGSKGSQHVRGMALDFSVYTMTPDEIRMILLPRLDHLNIRMELNTPTWVHVDAGKVIGGQSRTFDPKPIHS